MRRMESGRGPWHRCVGNAGCWFTALALASLQSPNFDTHPLTFSHCIGLSVLLLEVVHLLNMAYIVSHQESDISLVASGYSPEDTVEAWLYHEWHFPLSSPPKHVDFLYPLCGWKVEPAFPTVIHQSLLKPLSCRLMSSASATFCLFQTSGAPSIFSADLGTSMDWIVPPTKKRYVHILTPGSCECEQIWKKHLCRCN